MGDRAIIVVKGKDGYTPGVYLHWGGSHVVELLRDAQGRMRQGDSSYAIARICGVAHEGTPGVLGLGIIPGPTEGDTWESYTQGDSGVAVVEINTGRVTFHAGYLEDQYPDGLKLELAQG
jgi:hypothetical protein